MVDGQSTDKVADNLRVEGGVDCQRLGSRAFRVNQTSDEPAMNGDEQ